MLQLNWFSTEPLDFEHKNYLLLAYLSEIDSSFSIHRLSPYLLYTEKLITELDVFKVNLELFEKTARREMIGFSFKTGPIYSDVKRPDKFDEIIEIVNFSKPLLESKLKLGYKLFEKFPQLLY